MKISHRLYLTVAPAIVAVLLLVGLMYWGEYGRTAPEIVILGGALAVFSSLVLTWSNARFIARRIERIAGASTALDGPKPTLRGIASAMASGKTSGPPDEIDAIESVMDRLSSAVAMAAVKSADHEKLFEQRAHDYARLLASIADASARRLEEVRLPLHILLENHFGDLNENQEEMLGAARAAAEAVDADMLGLRQIAELDLGERPLRNDRMKPSEILEALRPMLTAAAQGAGVTLELEVAPLLPAIIGDRALLQDALVTVMRGIVSSASRNSRVRIGLASEGSMIRFAVHGDGVAPVTVRLAAAVRVIQAHGGTVERTADKVQVGLPVEEPAT